MSNYLNFFSIISHYSRVSQPSSQELADTQTCPMHRTMADKYLGGPEELHDEKGTPLYQDDSICLAESTLSSS